MSKRTPDSLDERYESPEEELDTAPRSGRHLKKAAGPVRASRRVEAEPKEEEDFMAAPVPEEELPRRERRVREEETPRRTRRAPEEETPRRERRSAEDTARRERSRRAEPVPHRKKKKKKKKSRTGLAILIVVLAVLAVLALAGYFLFMHFYGMLNTGNGKTAPTPTPAAAVIQTTPDAAATPEPTPEPTPTPEPLTEEELAALAEMELRASLQEDAEEIMFNENVYNLLLIGTDGLGDVMERSDSMILLSINKDTGQIWVTSLMRDTQVTIPGFGLGHLNWATSLGNSKEDPFNGINTLIATLESEKNFAIHIDSWAMVNFLDFVKVANLLGPITVTVNANEVNNMNQMIVQVCQMIDESEGRGMNEEGNIPRYLFRWDESGTYTLTDGAQILGYCRERKVGGDTGRSEKQRNVVMQMMANIQNMTLAEQYELATAVLPLITTNITRGQAFSLLLQLPSIKDYQIHTQQCPVPGSFWKGRDHNNLSIYSADFAVNRNFLRATIYGQRFTARELTSSWTGESVLVYWNDEWN